MAGDALAYNQFNARGQEERRRSVPQIVEPEALQLRPCQFRLKCAGDAELAAGNDAA